MKVYRKPLCVVACLGLPSFAQGQITEATYSSTANQSFFDGTIAYQAENHLYASLLAPKKYSTRGSELNLFTLTRFLEVFGYCSHAHGYSLQVSFLGLLSILMGTNDALKKEAVASLENGGLFAFGISEKNHGSDLLANQFTIRETAAGQFLANGTKYYIGNANAAAIIFNPGA